MDKELISKLERVLTSRKFSQENSIFSDSDLEKPWINIRLYLENIHKKLGNAKGFDESFLKEFSEGIDSLLLYESEEYSSKESVQVFLDAMNSKSYKFSKSIKTRPLGKN